MNNLHSFRKLPECDRCQFYTGNPHLPCAVHPHGATGSGCLDFREDLAAVHQWEQFLGLDWVEEPWQPEGASYYNGELILTPEQRWSQMEQLNLLDWHPMFTGRCPECEMAITQTDPPRVHWDCSGCGWKDDTV